MPLEGLSELVRSRDTKKASDKEKISDHFSRRKTRESPRDVRYTHIGD